MIKQGDIVIDACGDIGVVVRSRVYYKGRNPLTGLPMSFTPNGKNGDDVLDKYRVEVVTDDGSPWLRLKEFLTVIDHDKRWERRKNERT